MKFLEIFSGANQKTKFCFLDNGDTPLLTYVQEIHKEMFGKDYELPLVNLPDLTKYVGKDIRCAIYTTKSPDNDKVVLSNPSRATLLYIYSTKSHQNADKLKETAAFTRGAFIYALLNDFHSRQIDIDRAASVFGLGEDKKEQTLIKLDRILKVKYLR
jgi:hypothetical protein